MQQIKNMDRSQAKKRKYQHHLPRSEMDSTSKKKQGNTKALTWQRVDEKEKGKRLYM
jgi:hypothetical protein